MRVREVETERGRVRDERQVRDAVTERGIVVNTSSFIPFLLGLQRRLKFDLETFTVKTFEAFEALHSSQ